MPLLLMHKLQIQYACLSIRFRIVYSMIKVPLWLHLHFFVQYVNPIFGYQKIKFVLNECIYQYFVKVIGQTEKVARNALTKVFLIQQDFVYRIHKDYLDVPNIQIKQLVHSVKQINIWQRMFVSKFPKKIRLQIVNFIHQLIHVLSVKKLIIQKEINVLKRMRKIVKWL